MTRRWRWWYCQLLLACIMTGFIGGLQWYVHTVRVWDDLAAEAAAYAASLR